MAGLELVVAGALPAGGPLLGDAGGPALVGGFFVLLAVALMVLGVVVGLVVFLIARTRARRRLEHPPAGPPPG